MTGVVPNILAPLQSSSSISKKYQILSRAMNSKLISYRFVKRALPPIGKVAKRVNQSFALQSFSAKIDDRYLLAGMRGESLCVACGNEYSVIGDRPYLHAVFHIVQ